MKRLSRPLAGLLAIALGTLGGWIGVQIQLPLAWLIGAMAATTLAAVFGAPVALPNSLRNAMIAVLGVMLGSGFRPEILGQLGDWALSLASLIGYVAVAGAAGHLFFRRVAGYDRPTAFFSAMPGGLSEMVLVGQELGGDIRIISLIHASRVLLVVLALPVAFQLLAGYQPAARPPPGLPLVAIPGLDLAILAGCGIAGTFGARALRIPAAPLVGPMILSAALHLAGATAAAPPLELVIVAQIVVGTAIGCRFAGIGFAMIARTLALACGGTAILLLATVAFAYGLEAATGRQLTALVLAFAPGGVAEMSLIALALAMDVAFVATHHIVRICLIVMLAPQLFRLARRRMTEHQ